MNLATKDVLFSLLVYTRITIYDLVKKTDALVYLLNNIGTKLYRQTNSIPIGTNCALLVADLFLFRYERDFVKLKFVSRENQTDISGTFNSTSRYLDN